MSSWLPCLKLKGLLAPEISKFTKIYMPTQLAKKGNATVSKGKRMLLFLIQW